MITTTKFPESNNKLNPNYVPEPSAKKVYIELEVAHDEIKKFQEKLETNDDKAWAVNKPYYKGLAIARGILNEIHAADVELVRHGKWIKKRRGAKSPEGYYYWNTPLTHVFVCSECGRQENKREPYCHCGAKMYKEE